MLLLEHLFLVLISLLLLLVRVVAVDACVESLFQERIDWIRKIVMNRSTELLDTCINVISDNIHIRCKEGKCIGMKMKR